MSIGGDARIGLGFDRNRSNSVAKNKCVYCWEGVKKLFLKTMRINQVIDTLEILHQQDLQEQGLDYKESTIDLNIEEKGKQVQQVFQTKLARSKSTQQSAA